MDASDGSDGRVPIDKLHKKHKTQLVASFFPSMPGRAGSSAAHGIAGAKSACLRTSRRWRLSAPIRAGARVAAGATGAVRRQFQEDRPPSDRVWPTEWRAEPVRERVCVCVRDKGKQLDDTLSQEY